MLSALLLDLDRTLVEAQSYIDYCAALSEVGLESDAQRLISLPGTDWDACAERILQILASTSGDRWREVSRRVEVHEIAAVESTQLMPFAHQFLAETADMPRGIVTSMGQLAAARVVDHHRIEARVVVGRNTNLRLKPAPDQLLEALRVLDVPASRALMVGDSAWDALAAAEAGVRFIGISNGRKTTTFDSSTLVVCDALELLDVVTNYRSASATDS